MNAIRINDTDVYEDVDVGDKDIDALTTCIQMCARDIDPQVLVISQMPIRLRTTQTVFTETFQSLTCLVLHHALDNDGIGAAVQQQGLMAVLTAMPNLIQLYAYIIDAHAEDDEEKAGVFDSILRLLPPLKDLELRYIVVGDPTVNISVSSTCLERLAMFVPADHIITNFLRECSEIIEPVLDVDGCLLDIENITIIAQKFPNLRHLELDWTAFIMSDARCLNFKHLQTLRLINSEFWNLSHVVDPLCHSPQLKALDLSASPIPDEEIVFIPSEAEEPFDENCFISLSKHYPDLSLRNISSLFQVLPSMLLAMTKHLISLQILIMQNCCLDMIQFSSEEKKTLNQYISKRENLRLGLTSLLLVKNMQIDDGEELYLTVKYIMGLDGVLMRRDIGSKGSVWSRVTSGSHEWHQAVGSRMFHLDSSWPVMDMIRRNTPRNSQ